MHLAVSNPERHELDQLHHSLQAIAGLYQSSNDSIRLLLPASWPEAKYMMDPFDHYPTRLSLFEGMATFIGPFPPPQRGTKKRLVLKVQMRLY
jgi:hypothetical protein